MADYGHDLVFGTFLTPQRAEPQAPVALARLSERAGLDLVTFQDHPYQPAFLDTWTLLSYVAASTERIKISGNWINLPLRPPVLLARQAASLALLSGGRFELGLGAGSFWDAIEAMGGPRRSPAQAVASLSEAIDTAVPGRPVPQLRDRPAPTAAARRVSRPDVDAAPRAESHLRPGERLRPELPDHATKHGGCLRVGRPRRSGQLWPGRPAQGGGSAGQGVRV